MKSILTKFKENKGYSILLLLILLNIALRIPIMPHEMGADSFVYHYGAKYVSVNHQLLQSLKPIEFSTEIRGAFGLYPFIEPPLLNLTLSFFSQVIGLDLELTILFFSIFLGILGLLSSYLMARELSDNEIFQFIVPFLFTTSPIFLSFTLWTASPRIMLMSFLPLFIWSFLRFMNTKKWSYLFLALSIFVIMSSIHFMFVITSVIWGAFILTVLYSHVKVRARPLIRHMTLFLFILFISIVLSLFFIAYTIWQLISMYMFLLISILIIWCVVYLIKTRHVYVESRVSKLTRNLWVVASIILFFMFIVLFLIPFLSGIQFFERMKWTYHSGFFFLGWENYKIFGNMLVDYGSSAGILLPIGLLGFITLLKNAHRNETYLFLTLIMLFCTPALLHGEYLTIFMAPFFSILVGFGILDIIKRFDSYHKLVTGFVAGCLLISLLFSFFMIGYWFPKPGASNLPCWKQERTDHASAFLRCIDVTGIVSNDAYIGLHISLELPTHSPHMDDSVYLVENEYIPGQTVGALGQSGRHRIFKNLLFLSLRDDRRMVDKIYDNGLNGIWEPISGVDV